jgi:hypothetical protein
MDLPSDKRGCHHTGFMKKCKALVTSGKCERWIHVVGQDKNTGEQINRHGCADDWHVSLTIENTLEARHTAAAVESFRNAMVAQNNVLNILGPQQKRLGDG